MKLSDLTLFAILNALTLPKSMAVPMNSNDHTDHYWGDTSHPPVHNVWNSASNEAGSSNFHHDAPTHHVAQSNNPYHVNVDLSLGPGSDPNLANSYWNHHAQNPQYNNAGHLYDMNPHFNLGMALTSTKPIREAQLAGKFHPDALFLPYYKPPTALERFNRYGSYNDFEWQRSLKIEDLENVYKSIGTLWGLMPESSLRNAWLNLNRVLDEDPDLVLNILHGKEGSAQAAASRAKKERSYKSRGPSSKEMITVTTFLERKRSKKGFRAQPNVIEDMNLGPDMTNEGRPRWAPFTMDKRTQLDFKAQLRTLWNMKAGELKKVLIAVGPSIITRFYEDVLSNNSNTARQAAQDLWSAYTEGAQHNQNHQEEQPNPAVEAEYAHHQDQPAHHFAPAPPYTDHYSSPNGYAAPNDAQTMQQWLWPQHPHQ